MGGLSLWRVDEQDNFASGRVGFEMGEDFHGGAAMIGFKFLRQLTRDAGACLWVNFR